MTSNFFFGFQHKFVSHVGYMLPVSVAPLLLSPMSFHFWIQAKAGEAPLWEVQEKEEESCWDHVVTPKVSAWMWTASYPLIPTCQSHMMKLCVDGATTVHSFSRRHTTHRAKDVGFSFRMGEWIIGKINQSASMSMISSPVFVNCICFRHLHIWYILHWK